MKNIQALNITNKLQLNILSNEIMKKVQTFVNYFSYENLSIGHTKSTDI